MAVRIKTLQSYETLTTVDQSTQSNIPENLHLYDLCLFYRPRKDPKVYNSATRRLRVKARRLQGNRHRISQQHGPATSLANVDCKKRPISPAGINSEKKKKKKEKKKKKKKKKEEEEEYVPTNLIS